jgi:hypothetical protein
MKDLLDYNRFRMEALHAQICKLEHHISTLETYVFELADLDCPDEYKTIIKKELYNSKNN